jgi:hypothetical protein
MAMYALSILFMLVGVSLAGLVIFSELRVRAIYAVALVLGGMLGVVAVKAARRQQRLTTVSTTPVEQPPQASTHAEAATQTVAPQSQSAPTPAPAPRNGSPIGHHA